MLFYRHFPFTFPFFHLVPYRTSSSFSIFISVFLLNMNTSIASFKSVFGNDLGKSAKDPGLKIKTGVSLYEEQDGRPNAVVAVNVFAAGLTAQDALQSRVHGVDLNRRSDSDLTVIYAVVIKIKDSPFRTFVNSTALRSMKSKKPWGTCPRMASTSRTCRT